MLCRVSPSVLPSICIYQRRSHWTDFIIIIIIIIITCVTQLGHLLTRSGLTYLEVSSEVCHDSFCQLGNSVSLSWVVCRETFCLHVVTHTHTYCLSFFVCFSTIMLQSDEYFSSYLFTFTSTTHLDYCTLKTGRKVKTD